MKYSHPCNYFCNLPFVYRGGKKKKKQKQTKEERFKKELKSCRVK